MHCCLWRREMSFLAFIGNHSSPVIGPPCPVLPFTVLTCDYLFQELGPQCYLDHLFSPPQLHSLDMRPVALAYAQHTVCAVYLAAQLVIIFTKPEGP